MNPTQSRTRSLLRFWLVAGMIGCLSGCVTKVVVVDPRTSLVRLGDDVKGHVYFYTGTNWVKSSNKVKLPEGWYAGIGPE